MALTDPYLQAVVSDAFEITEKIGEGGMGRVYAARQRSDGVFVALKILRIEEAQGTPGALERFRREVEVLQALRHPGIVSYVANGITERGDPYVAMELLHGQPLMSLMKEGPLSLSMALSIGLQVCEALAYAHARGVIHRDIKPANLFLIQPDLTPLASKDARHQSYGVARHPSSASTEAGLRSTEAVRQNGFLRRGTGGEVPMVKLIDFGIARFVDDRRRLTRSGNILGTPAYMAPEQIRGYRSSDDRADLYSLGVTLYEAISGQMPLEAPDTLSLLLKILETPPRPLRELVNVPSIIEALLQRALAKDPIDRFQSATEMAAALRSVQQSRTSTQGQRPTPSPSSSLRQKITVQQPSPSPSTNPSSIEESTQEALPSWLEETSGELRRVIVVVVSGTWEEPELLQEAEQRLTEAGGHTERLYDGRVVGLFGASHSYGDEARRAVVSALQSRKDSLRIGVASGRVLSARTLFSDAATPEAAALAARANPGELLLSQETFASIRGLFDVEPAGGGAWRVLSERPHGFLIGTRGLLGVETPTVGREAEIALMRSLIESVPTLESPQATLILGDAGLGKSRLKYELRLMLEEMQTPRWVVEGSGDPVRSQTPYSLLRSAIRNLCATHPSDPPQVLKQKLSALFDSLGYEPDATKEYVGLLWAALDLDADHAVQEDPKRLRTQIVEAFVALFRGLSRRAPIVFILEDLHWADSTTLEIVERILAEPSLRLLFIGLGRPALMEAHPDFLGQASCTQLLLRPLGKNHLRQLLEAFLRTKPPEELTGFLLDATGGSPFLVESMLVQLWNQGFLQPVPGGGFSVARSVSSIDIPEGAEALLQSRLDSLPPEEKELVKKASVFGKTFWSEALGALRISDAPRLLERLRGREIIALRPMSRFENNKEYVFRHSLLQEVAYRLLPLQDRQMLHAKAATWLIQAGEKDPFILARHYELAAEKERASELYAAAAKRAAQEYAKDSALSALQRAKSLTNDDTLRFEVLLLEEDLRFWSGEREAERNLLDMLVELSSRLGERARAKVTYREGRYAEMTGEYARSEERSRAAIALAQQVGDTELELKALVTLCGNLVHTGRYAEVQSLAEHGLSLTKKMRRPELEGGLQMRLQLVNARRGSLGPAIKHAEAALVSARAAQDRHMEVSALASLGSMCSTAGRYQDAERYLTLAVTLSEKIRSSVALAFSRMNLGHLLAITGRFEEALTELNEASQIAQRTEHPALPDCISCYLSHLYLLRGASDDPRLAYEEASRVLSSVQRVKSSTTEKQFATLAYSWRAKALLLLERPKEALFDIEAALQLRTSVSALEEGEEELLLHHYQILAALGEDAKAEEALAKAQAFVEARAKVLSDPRSYLNALAPRAIAELNAAAQGDFLPTMRD